MSGTPPPPRRRGECTIGHGIQSTLRRSLALSAASWVGYLAWYPSRASPLQNEIAFPWLVFTIYAPALLLLLLLPKDEERATTSIPGSGPQTPPAS